MHQRDRRQKVRGNSRLRSIDRFAELMLGEKQLSGKGWGRHVVSSGVFTRAGSALDPARSALARGLSCAGYQVS